MPRRPSRVPSAPIDQAVAGTTELVPAAGPGRSICVVSYLVVMDGEGTFQFVTGSTERSGEMPVADKGGVAFAGTEGSPAFTGGPNEALSIVTTDGAARGHVAYFIT